MHTQQQQPHIVSRHRLANRGAWSPFEDMRDTVWFLADRDKSRSVAGVRFISIFDAAIVSVGRLNSSASALLDTVTINFKLHMRLELSF